MKETLANKIDAMQRRMLTNAAGARRKAYDASVKKRDDAAVGARSGTAPADAAAPAADGRAKR